VSDITVERTDSGWKVTVEVDELVDEASKQRITDIANAAASVLDAVDELIQSVQTAAHA